MELNKYQELSKRTLDKNKTDREMLLECCLGFPEEMGEAISPIKKYLFHGHELNKEKVIEELGDSFYYMNGICTLLDITLEEVAKANIEKLEKRYPQGFTQEASINREENCVHEWLLEHRRKEEISGEYMLFSICTKCRETKVEVDCTHEWQYIVDNSNMINPKFQRECRKCGKKGE